MRRNLGLDILRFIAVLLVIGRHLKLPPDPNLLLRLWQRGGWIGVDVFFVLSGFLVSSLLFKEYIQTGAIDIKRFLIRRGFKIYPAFWILIAFSLLVMSSKGGLPPVKKIFAELLFVQNYLGGIWNHTWSLAVEEHFYISVAIVFAFIISVSPNHKFRAIPGMFVVVALSCLFFRLVNLLLFPEYSHQVYLYGTHIRIDSLFFGVLLSYFYHFRNLEGKIASVPSWLFIIVGSMLLSPAFVFTLQDHKWLSVIGVIPIYIGSGAILLAALRLKQSSKIILQAIGGLGGASYSIYLWHMPVNVWGYPVISSILKTNSFEVYILTYLIVSCMFGWFMNRVIEYPVLYIRDAVFPKNI